MCPERTPEIFDAWAENYDYWVKIGSDSFPFQGYNEVLSRIVELTDPKPDSRVLDVGIGTGNLSQRFIECGCEIWGIDYSSRMLEEAKKKVPDAHLLKTDVESEWPSVLRKGFDHIVSAYTLHHLTIDRKIAVIKRLADELLMENGSIVVGDISFPSSSARAEARKKLASVWDEYEYYWAADEFKTMIVGLGFHVVYEQISDYAGVYVIVPKP
ncbi:MAG: class I SAM-dependent methyltransferase [Candidatus Thorarchaeota archaeon]